VDMWNRMLYKGDGLPQITWRHYSWEMVLKDGLEASIDNMYL
jgi:hypothetical protein